MSTLDVDLLVPVCKIIIEMHKLLSVVLRRWLVLMKPGPAVHANPAFYRLSVGSWMILVLPPFSSSHTNDILCPTTTPSLLLLRADLHPHSLPAWPSMVTMFTHLFCRPFALAHSSQRVFQDGILHSFYSSCEQRISDFPRFRGCKEILTINQQLLVWFPCFSLLSS